MTIEVGSYIRIGTNLERGSKGNAVVGVAADIPPTSSGNYCIYYQLGNGYTGSLSNIQSMIGTMVNLSDIALNRNLSGTTRIGMPIGGGDNSLVEDAVNATFDGMILFFGGLVRGDASGQSLSHYFDVTTKELRNLWLEQAKDN